jgi:2-oxo-3-hexenedioate decarboxylase
VTLQKIADEIRRHQIETLELDKITARYDGLSLQDAYEIQRLTSQTALETGDRFIGWKMGLTSIAKQQSVGVNQPIYGRLLESMKMNDSTLHLANFIHPRVEPEFAFLFNKRLEGENITEEDVWVATECIMTAFEIIDSRYKDFSFNLIDVVADNASSAKFMVSKQVYTPKQYQWDQIRVELKLNGRMVQKGVGSDVLGNPVRSIVELLRMLARTGECIEPGMIVLTGGITEAIPVNKGDEITVDFDGLGTLGLNVTQ